MIDATSAPQPLVATCSRGLNGGLREVFAANLRLRTAMRVVVPIARGQVRGRDELYDLATTVAWHELIGRGQTLCVDVAGRSRAVRNTAFAAQVVKDAVVDLVRDRGGWRPSVDRDKPDLRLHLHLSDGVTSLSLDSTGEPLSHRGYRPRGGPAPLSESLAAGILLLAGYDGSEPLLDPMCGTGTFVVEAALIATRTPPGLRREFAFEKWPVHDQPLFREVIHHANRDHRDAPAPIVGRDRDERAVQAAQRNLKAAWMNRSVVVEQSSGLDLGLPWSTGGIIIANPPYGKRMGDVKRLGNLYQRIGDRLKRDAIGATAWLLVGNRELANRIGLKPTRRIPLFNGPIECRLLKYELYSGSRRPSQSS